MNPTLKIIPATLLTLLVGLTASVANSWTVASSPLDENNSVAQSLAQTDTLVIPGERVGPITRNTTRRDLVRLFGDFRLRDQTISRGEGKAVLVATEVNLGPERSVTVVWTDNSRTEPGDVHIVGSAWKTREGVGVNLSWSQLQQKLGEFQLYGLGLGGNYSGIIELKGTKLSRYQDHLILVAAPDLDAAARFPSDYEAVMGDSLFSSTNPHWKPLGMRIRDMIVILNRDRSI